jgi:hypothetical protein
MRIKVQVKDLNQLQQALAITLGFKWEDFVYLDKNRIYKTQYKKRA